MSYKTNHLGNCKGSTQNQRKRSRRANSLLAPVYDGRKRTPNSDLEGTHLKKGYPPKIQTMTSGAPVSLFSLWSPLHWIGLRPASLGPSRPFVHLGCTSAGLRICFLKPGAMGRWRPGRKAKDRLLPPDLCTSRGTSHSALQVG